MNEVVSAREGSPNSEAVRASRCEQDAACLIGLTCRRTDTAGQEGFECVGEPLRTKAGSETSNERGNVAQQERLDPARLEKWSALNEQVDESRNKNRKPDK